MTGSPHRWRSSSVSPTAWCPTRRCSPRRSSSRTVSSKQPQQALQETKRALNLHLQNAIQNVAPFALSSEAESFSTEDVKNTVDRFKEMLEKQREK